MLVIVPAGDLTVTVLCSVIVDIHMMLKAFRPVFPFCSQEGERGRAADLGPAGRTAPRPHERRPRDRTGSIERRPRGRE